ncbi:MAG: DUF4347 domain-containing protein [Kovacikia sp.]
MDQLLFSANPLLEPQALSTFNLTGSKGYSDLRIPLSEASWQPLQRSSTTTTLVFIDARVSEYPTLLTGLEPGAEAYILSPVQDAIAQITQILLNYTGISSLQIISHGRSGELQLGETGLNRDNLNRYVSQLASWKKALIPHADILLYACDLAQGEEGKTFVRRLAELTGEDVAASDDRTGSSTIGGDWNLEFQVGEITAPLAFQSSTLQKYGAFLQSAPVLNTSGNPRLDAISQGTVDSAGTPITTLISRLGGTGITDVDGDPPAIAVTGVDNTNGIWQFSTNGGASWSNFGSVSDTSATLLGPTSLYLSGLGTQPDTQSWLSFTSQDVTLPFNAATQTLSSGGTILNSTTNNDNGIYAGYSNYTSTGELKNPGFPTLDRNAGYSLTFNLQVLSESRTNQNRAGSSIIALSSDGTRGIELGFQQLSSTTGNIFAQGDGVTPNPGGQTNGLFLAAENSAFNLNQQTAYTLSVKGNTYQLWANGVQILTGPLRDYTAFNSPFPINPYRLSNFVFLGDNTSSAQASIKLSQILIQTDTRIRFVPTPTYSGTANLTFRAWDTSNGLANGTTGVNASINGNAAAFSADSETASITVTGSNPGSPTPQKPIYWRNDASGQNSIWQINGTTFSTAFSLPTANPNWTISGVADFSGDSKDDILWRNRVTGQIAIWQLDGTAYSTSYTLPTVNVNWKIVGIADFDGDQKADLLWRNSVTGQTAIWKMNGTSFSTSYALPSVIPSWTIVGIADFDGDQKADLLWRNSVTGQTAIWKMNGTSFSTSYNLPTVSDINWKIGSLTDFDGDGKIDLLWRNYQSGKNVIWQLNHTTFSTAIALPSVVSSTWRIY